MKSKAMELYLYQLVMFCMASIIVAAIVGAGRKGSLIMLLASIAISSVTYVINRFIGGL